jgi:hypothetical protein
MKVTPADRMKVTPTDWNLALSTIEGFKKAHLQGFLITIVVGKLYQS